MTAELQNVRHTSRRHHSHRPPNPRTRATYQRFWGSGAEIVIV